MDSGYYRFHKDFIQYEADSTRQSKQVDLTLRLLKYRTTSESPETLHPRYTIHQVNYLSNDSTRLHLRRRVLEHNTAIKTGEPF